MQDINNTLSGKHALITGAGRGIGASIAAHLAAAGCKVTLLGRNLETLKQQTEIIPGALPLQCDVTNEAEVVAAFASATDYNGPVDILVNNAGAAKSAPFKRTSPDLLQQMLDVNLRGPFLCTHQVLEQMTKQGFGRVINIASTAALKGYTYVSAYAAAKHGVLGLTRCLSLEVAEQGVTINAICPGFTETDIVSHSIDNIVHITGRSQEEARQELVKNNPQKRMIAPSEIANTVIWLCQPESNSINGQAIVIAGGEIM